MVADSTLLDLRRKPNRTFIVLPADIKRPSSYDRLTYGF
ncbi:hypothetical protein C7S13_8734 [Burkholderia cepacia]|nr:hypothetical protein [Burkholderia cepacia]